MDITQPSMVETNFIEATEIFGMATCPLDCKYCYIPKTNQMKEIHNELLNAFKTENLLLPKSIKILSIWGTEPFLILDNISDEILSYLKKNYNNLEEISFSTSFILSIVPLERFVQRLKKYNLKLDLQISLDGPPFITDENRGKGITDKILNNYWDFLDYLENTDPPEIKIHFKPTLTLENLKSLLDKDNISQYSQFFSDIQDKVKSYSIPEQVRIFTSPMPTIAVPGNYSSSDGRLFAEFLELLHKCNMLTTYDFRLARTFKYVNEFFSKPRQMTCSGGDSNLGFDPRTLKYHICHRTFFLDDERYVKSVLNMDKYKNWDVSVIEKNSLENLTKNYMVKKHDFPKFLYVMRGYHDFFSFRLSSTISLIYELAYAGQISSQFLLPEFAFLFAMFLQVSASCPVEDILLNGSPHIFPLSLIRMYGNGAFQELLRFYFENRR